jgi:hypothetical protein
MNAGKLFLSIGLSTLLLQFFLPWWVIAVIAFAMTIFFRTGKLISFCVSFLAVFLCWTLRAYWVNSVGDVSVAALTGNILGGIAPSSAIFLTGLVGGLTAGLSAVSGSMFREVITDKKY